MMDYNDADQILKEQKRKTDRNIDITLEYLYGLKVKKRHSVKSDVLPKSIKND